MSLISRGQDFLNRQMAQAAAVDGGVTYTRTGTGAFVLAGVTAWVGRTVFRQDQQHGNGASVVFGERDYLIPASELPNDPQRGDQITEDGVGTFEAVAPGGEPAWRWSDQTRTVFRIHTKKVS